MKNANQFPIEVRRSGVAVKIYRTQSAAGYVSFQVPTYVEGKRKVRTFSDLEEAKREAEFIANRLASGEAVASELGPRERATFARVLELLAPSGATPELAASTYAQAVKLLGGDRVLEVVREHARRNPVARPVKLVPEIVAELLEAKAKAGAGLRYMQDLKHRLGKFADAFNRPVASVTGGEIQGWLDGLELGPQSRVNFARVLGQLVGFAKRKGYLPKDHDELEKLEKPNVRNGDAIEVFTPDELRKLLAAASPDYLPALVIGGFCGLRTAELERLDWAEVRVAERFVEVTAGKSKTASRRIVPLCEAACAWLANHVRESGKVWRGGRTTICDASADTAKAAGIAWKANGLRHSFISYRLALIQNAAQTSLEAGNSPQVCFKHYRELVRPVDAQKWFATVPPAPAANVIQLKAAA